MRVTPILCVTRAEATVAGEEFQALFALLVCPLCRGTLDPDEGGSVLHCRNCDKDYPVVEGIPCMIPSE